MSNDNIDKGLETLQSKLGAHEFEFDDQMWEKMEVKLDAKAGFLATWGKKASALLALTAVRWSVVLLLIGGSVYFFTKPLAEANILSEHTTSSLPAKGEVKESKSNLALTSKEGINSTKSVLQTQAVQNKVASTLDKNVKNTSKTITETVLESTQNNIIYSKNTSKVITSDKSNISTDSKFYDNDNNNLIAKEEASINKKALFPYTQNSSSTDALIIEKISSLLTNVSNTTTTLNLRNPTLPKKSKNHFGITAGYLFNTIAPKVHINDNIYLGVVYNRAITTKLRLGLSIGIKNMRLSKAIALNYKDVLIAPTGKATYQLSKKNSKFQYLEGNIYLQYLLPLSKSSFKLGIRPSYIIQDLEKRVSSNSAGYGYNYPTSKAAKLEEIRETDYYGIRRFNLGVMLGYQYQINNKWSVGLDYTQGLIDISKNETFSDNTLHRNTDLQVGITYWIR